MARPMDETRRLGEVAMAMGLLDPEALDRSIATAEDRQRRGEEVSLLQIFVQERLLSTSDVEAVLAASSRCELVCPGCRKRYRVQQWQPGNPILCRACGQPLAYASDRTARAPASPPPAVRVEAGRGAVIDSVVAVCGPTAAVLLEGSPPDEGRPALGRYSDAEEIGRGGMGRSIGLSTGSCSRTGPPRCSIGPRSVAP